MTKKSEYRGNYRANAIAEVQDRTKGTWVCKERHPGECGRPATEFRPSQMGEYWLVLCKDCARAFEGPFCSLEGFFKRISDPSLHESIDVEWSEQLHKTHGHHYKMNSFHKNEI